MAITSIEPNGGFIVKKALTDKTRKILALLSLLALALLQVGVAFLFKSGNASLIVSGLLV